MLYMMGLIIKAFIIFALICSASSRKLVVKDSSGASSSDYTLRAYSLYLKKGIQSVNIDCSLPKSYNETAEGKATVQWDGTSSSRLTVRALSAAANYTCTARNVHQKPIAGWEDTVLHVYREDGSIRITGPQSKAINYSDPDVAQIDFSCDPIDEKIQWLLDGQLISPSDKHAHIFTNNTLVITSPNYKHVGIYMCRSEQGDKLAYYSLEGKPYFVQKHSGKNEDSENKLEGHNVSIIHELYGNPLKDLEWFVKPDDDDTRKELNDDDPRINLYPTMNVSNGELELSKLEKSDRAYYICVAKNEHGSAEFSTLVRVKGQLDALWPFLGIVLEVIVLVAIILIYERRRLKRESEADEAMDQKKPLTTAANSEGARQRTN